MRTKRFDRVSNQVSSLCAILLLERHTHAEWLRLRGSLFEQTDWKKLSGPTRSYFTAYMRGYLEAIERTHLVWCHKVNGVFVESDGPYGTPSNGNPRYTTEQATASVNAGESKFCWRGTQRVFY